MKREHGKMTAPFTQLCPSLAPETGLGSQGNPLPVYLTMFQRTERAASTPLFHPRELRLRGATLPGPQIRSFVHRLSEFVVHAWL